VNDNGFLVWRTVEVEVGTELAIGITKGLLISLFPTGEMLKGRGGREKGRERQV